MARNNINCVPDVSKRKTERYRKDVQKYRPRKNMRDIILMVYARKYRNIGSTHEAKFSFKMDLKILLRDNLLLIYLKRLLAKR